jgi:hypothetical protein
MLPQQQRTIPARHTVAGLADEFAVPAEERLN